MYKNTPFTDIELGVNSMSVTLVCTAHNTHTNSHIPSPVYER